MKYIKKTSYIDFDKTIFITIVTTNIGYQLAEAIGDKLTKGFNIGGKVNKSLNLPIDSYNIANFLKYIPLFSLSIISGDTGDIGEDYL